MYNLLRKINQNRRQILIAILAIVFAFIIKQALNNAAKEKQEKNRNEIIDEIRNSQKETSTYNPSYSVTTGETISSENSKENINIIETFINYCNNGMIQEAYDILSDDCKQEIYQTIDIFEKNYYDINFKTKKLHSSQLWTAYTTTYKVELYEDSLATGKVDNVVNIQDYYTIVRENGKNKLNISEYIGKQEINKKVTKNDITFLIQDKKIYREHEIYTIKVKNNTKDNILIDSKESTKNIYLIGDTGATYTSYLYELSQNDIKVKSNYENILQIKFNKQHTSSGNIKTIVFKDIILNAEEYESAINKKKYENRMQIEISI